MLREYYVMHSSHRDGKNYVNALTFVPESTIRKSKKGIYNYYHNGNLVWSVEDTVKLFTDCSDGTFYEFDPDDAEDIYPVYKKYSADCDRL